MPSTSATQQAEHDRRRTDVPCWERNFSIPHHSHVGSRAQSFSWRFFFDNSVIQMFPLIFFFDLGLWFYHLRSKFRQERSDFRLHFRLSGLIGLRSRGCPGSHRNPDREEKLILPGWRADT